jgi:hypothetical protein
VTFGGLSSAYRRADTPGVKRALVVLILGVLLPATLEGAALALTKSKPGAHESAWWTTGTGTGEEADCTKDEAGGTLMSVCYSEKATIAWRFRIPRGARLKGWLIYHGSSGAGCLPEEVRMVKSRPRRARITLVHYGAGDGQAYACNITSVVLKYRVPS